MQLHFKPSNDFFQGVGMCRGFAIFALMAAATAFGQSATQAAPAAKPVPAQPTAVIDTTVGKLTCTLFPDKAPVGVANFVGLSTGKKDWKSPSGTLKHGVPLYDGTIFHRVIPDFMIQGGDPAGTGSGPDPVKPFGIEVHPDLLFDRPGRLAYAKTEEPISISSQFFITSAAFTGQQASILNGHYTIFGQCDETSVELVKQIAAMSRDRNDKPYRPVKINHISITGVGAAAGAVKKPATTATPKPASN
jgi:peptidyl-prolyl cis-trans isomerase A (cyclophilin A)